MKHVEQMNLSWNYNNCPRNHFDYCGNENLQEWLKEQGLSEEEIPAAIEIADDYLNGLISDGRDCSCCIWFD